MAALGRFKALALAGGLSVVLGLATVSAAAAEPSDTDSYCTDYGGYGYCVQIWVDNGARHMRVWGYNGNQYWVVASN